MNAQGKPMSLDDIRKLVAEERTVASKAMPGQKRAGRHMARSRASVPALCDAVEALLAVVERLPCRIHSHAHSSRAPTPILIVAMALTGCAPDESLFGRVAPVAGSGGAPVVGAPDGGDVASSACGSGPGGSGGSGGAGPVLLAGVQENAALPFGWTECWAEPFSGIDTPVADIVAHCQGSLMALGCRPKGSSVFSLLAMAPRADVIFDTNPPTNPAKVHQANGVGWYFNEYGWGFAPAGDEVILGNCDVVDIKGGAPGVDGDLRMCVKFHSSPEWATHPGFRCGKLWEGAAPGFGVAYERVVLSAD